MNAVTIIFIIALGLFGINLVIDVFCIAGGGMLMRVRPELAWDLRLFFESHYRVTILFGVVFIITLIVIAITGNTSALFID